MKKEMETLKLDELRERAVKIARPPSDFKMIIEDYVEDEIASFYWENNEKEIVVELDWLGNLIKLIKELGESYEISDTVITEEKQKIAEQFILRYYPEILDVLILDECNISTDKVRFYYRQFVNNIPLKHAGCFVDIDNNGNITYFVYDGIKEISEIPTQLVSKEELKEHVKNSVNFRLIIKNIDGNLFDVDKSRVALVYEIDSCVEYDADKLETLVESIGEEKAVFSAVLPLCNSSLQKELSNEEIIGITNEFEIVREVDMGEEIGIVWRNKTYEERENNLSLDSYMRSRFIDSVKAKVSKETGKLTGFVWFIEREGTLQLSREECYIKALEFLENIHVDYCEYLKLIDKDSNRTKEIFNFQLHNGKGMLMDDFVNIIVNKNTGSIDSYSGYVYKLEQLGQIPSVPLVTLGEAKGIFMGHIDFQLVWDIDYEQKIYKLVYNMCDKLSKRKMMCIDAVTGEMISWKV